MKGPEIEPEQRRTHRPRTTAEVDTYRRLLSRIVELGRREGVEIEAVNPIAELRFSGLPADGRTGVLASLTRYVEILNSVAADGHSVIEDRRTLWSMMKQLGLRPTSELFGSLEDDDIVEIYLVPEFVQVFRSFKFFFLCSYSLDDLLCRPWWDLYHRDEVVTERIMRTIDEALKQPQPVTTDYDVGPHWLVERDSIKRFRSLQELRFVSPLFDERGRVGGIVNVVHPHKVVAGDVEREIDVLALSKRAGSPDAKA